MAMHAHEDQGWVQHNCATWEVRGSALTRSWAGPATPGGVVTAQLARGPARRQGRLSQIGDWGTCLAAGTAKSVLSTP